MPKIRTLFCLVDINLLCFVVFFGSRFFFSILFSVKSLKGGLLFPTEGGGGGGGGVDDVGGGVGVGGEGGGGLVIRVGFFSMFSEARDLVTHMSVLCCTPLEI